MRPRRAPVGSGRVDRRLLGLGLVGLIGLGRIVGGLRLGGLALQVLGALAVVARLALERALELLVAARKRGLGELGKEPSRCR
jgi:hypothetical protein